MGDVLVAISIVSWTTIRMCVTFMGHLFCKSRWTRFAHLRLYRYFAYVLLWFITSFLAILRNCTEELMELEISELKSFLQHLPSMDMDEVSDIESIIFFDYTDQRRLSHKPTTFATKSGPTICNINLFRLFCFLVELLLM